MMKPPFTLDAGRIYKMSSAHVELIPSEQLIMFETHLNYWINLNQYHM
jgi:hypothetical protein